MSEKLHEWRGHVNEFMEISVTTLRKLSILAEGLLKENAALVRRVEQLEHITDKQTELTLQLMDRLSDLEDTRS